MSARAGVRTRLQSVLVMCDLSGLISGAFTEAHNGRVRGAQGHECKRGYERVPVLGECAGSPSASCRSYLLERRL